MDFGKLGKYGGKPPIFSLLNGPIIAPFFIPLSRNSISLALFFKESRNWSTVLFYSMDELLKVSHVKLNWSFHKLYERSLTIISQ